jgi:hypothetical protein
VWRGKEGERCCCATCQLEGTEKICLRYKMAGRMTVVSLSYQYTTDKES